jgi:uncharacterized protein YcsI (UPF0317 family)
MRADITSSDSASGALPAARRAQFRAGLRRPTGGLCDGFQQANLVVVPREHAFDFLLFTARNPQACPLLDVVENGSWTPSTAPDADLRTDLPSYRVWRHGELVDEPADVRDVWRPDLVSFLLGCSFTAEHVLLAAGIPMRHLEQGRNVSMYDTGVACRPAGVFRGNLVVTMRPIRTEFLERVRQICAALPTAHGAPVHVGDPALLGIADLDRPDYGDAVEVRDGEVPVYWACGVTPQNVVRASGVDFVITHAPGHMFITDLPTPL